jgi:hypothetical protein
MKNINTIKGVKQYFHLLVKNYGLSFHPDDDFKSYLSHNTKERLFTDAEATHHNKLMDKCFVICNENNVDIYDLGLMIQQQSIL